MHPVSACAPRERARAPLECVQAAPLTLPIARPLRSLANNNLTAANVGRMADDLSSAFESGGRKELHRLK